MSWISFQPVEAAVAAGDSLPIQVTFDAGTPEIDQPGEYSMLLKLREDTPYLVDTLPVTLTISAPAMGLGRLDGVVTGRSPCGGDPVPLEKADLLIESSTGLTWTIQTNSSGFYAGAGSIPLAARTQSQCLPQDTSRSGCQYCRSGLELLQPTT